MRWGAFSALFACPGSEVEEEQVELGEGVLEALGLLRLSGQREIHGPVNRGVNERGEPGRVPRRQLAGLLAVRDGPDEPLVEGVCGLVNRRMRTPLHLLPEHETITVRAF